MRGWIYVHSADDYAKWAAENLTAEAKPADAAASDAKKDSTPADTTGGKAKK
jgi:hypothetical protein